MTNDMEPQLLKRATIELLNGIEVTSDIVRYIKTPKPLFLRVMNKMFGRDEQMMCLFNSHMASSVVNISTLITEIRDRVEESDLISIKMIAKIREIEKIISVGDNEIRSFRNEMNVFESRLQDFRADIELTQARQDVEDAFARLHDGYQDRVDLYQLWAEMDALWWGMFGVVIRRGRGNEAEKLIDSLRVKMRALFRSRTLNSDTLASRGVIVVGSLLDYIPVQLHLQSESLELMALYPEWNLRPLTKAILDRSVGNKNLPEEARAVPIVASVDRLGEKLFGEIRRGLE